MIKLYLVRHGETDCNLKGIIQNDDATLNETGIKQANIVKEKLNAIDYDIIISSPYTRARQTANIINIKNIPIIYDDMLKERDMGELKEKSMSYNSYNRISYWDYELNLSNRGIESIQSLFKRVECFIDYIKKNYNNKTVVVVSHSAIIRVINHVINNTDRTSNLREFEVDNACLLEYELEEINENI